MKIFLFILSFNVFSSGYIQLNVTEENNSFRENSLVDGRRVGTDSVQFNSSNLVLRLDPAEYQVTPVSYFLNALDSKVNVSIETTTDDMPSLSWYRTHVHVYNENTRQFAKLHIKKSSMIGKDLSDIEGNYEGWGFEALRFGRIYLTNENGVQIYLQNPGNSILSLRRLKIEISFE